MRAMHCLRIAATARSHRVSCASDGGHPEGFAVILWEHAMRAMHCPRIAAMARSYRIRGHPEGFAVILWEHAMRAIDDYPRISRSAATSAAHSSSVPIVIRRN